MLVSILIVNYNTGKILAECVKSVYNFENENEFEIIIADNCSSDDSASVIENLKSAHKNLKCIFIKDKVSFSEANNIAFDSSSGDYILIMNPDIIFHEPVIGKLTRDLSENSTLGAICPLLEGTDGKFQSRYFQKYPSILQFIFFYSIFAKLFQQSDFLTNTYLENRNLKPDKDGLAYIEQIPCAFFLTRRSIFSGVGKMDVGYELFFEDVDLSFKIGKHSKLAIDTSLRIEHLGGESFRKSDDFWLYGRFILSMINFFDNHYDGIRYVMLKQTARINSYAVLMMENFKKLFGREDDYRIRKHKYFLSEYRKTYC